METVHSVKMAKIILNISGKEYKITKKTLNKLPAETLETAVKDVSEECVEYYLERHPESFESILWYFTNGELHMPVNVCPAVFENELKFWNIEPDELSKCCYLRYVSFFEDQHLSQVFTTGEDTRRNRKKSEDNEKFGKWQTIQKRGWLMLEDPTSSSAAKIYVAISTLFILTSVFVICASTHPSFKRELFIQEIEDYFEDDPEKLEFIIKQNQYDVLKVKRANLEKRVETLCNTNSKTGTNCEVRKYRMALKIQNYTRVMFELSSALKSKSNCSDQDWTERKCKLANITNKNKDFTSQTHARYKYLDYIDACTVAYFAIELTMRILFCPHKTKFFYDFLNIFDVIALLSELIILLLEYFFPKEKYHDFSVLDAFECIQILRVFRVFRILKNSVDFRILVYSLRESVSNMCMMTFLLFIATLVFASIQYYSDRITFSSIPDAMWWAIITMTTVGYGDKYPTTAIGKVVGCVCAISGIFVLALLIPVLVNNFILFIGFAKILGKKSQVTKTNFDKEIDCGVPLMIEVAESEKDKKEDTQSL